MKIQHFGKCNEAEGMNVGILFITQQFHLFDADVISLIISSTVRKPREGPQEGCTNCGPRLWASQG